MRIRVVDVERFFAKVEVTPRCWLWRGATRGGTRAWDRGGPYGNFWHGGRNVAPHRFILEALGIDLGDQPVHHRCRVRLCVSPLHLDVVSVELNANPPPEAFFDWARVAIEAEDLL